MFLGFILGIVFCGVMFMLVTSVLGDSAEGAIICIIVALVILAVVLYVSLNGSEVFTDLMRVIN